MIIKYVWDAWRAREERQAATAIGQKNRTGMPTAYLQDQAKKSFSMSIL